MLKVIDVVDKPMVSCGRQLLPSAVSEGQQSSLASVPQSESGLQQSVPAGKSVI